MAAVHVTELQTMLSCSAPATEGAGGGACYYHGSCSSAFLRPTFSRSLLYL